MSMHPLFANWYQLVTPAPTADRLELRFAGIESFTSGIDTAKVLELTRLSFGIPPRSQEIVTEFKEAFKKADSAFLLEDNDLELKVLAASTLANCFDSSRITELKTAAALAVAATDFNGRRTGVAIPDLPSFARSYLVDEGIRARRLTVDFKKAKGGDLDKTQREALAGSFSGSDLTVLNAPLMDALKKLGSGQTEIASVLFQNVAKLREGICVLAEESNVHWWLFGESSRDLDRPFFTFGIPALTLIVGKELADLTELLPGFSASRAFLQKALMLADRDKALEKVKLSDAVGGHEGGWIALVIDADDRPIYDLCPLHFALFHSEEPKSKLGQAFSKAQGFKLTETAAPTDIAAQFYLERLLVRMAL